MIKSGLAFVIRSIAPCRQSAQLLILNAPTLFRTTSIEGQADLVNEINLNPFSLASF